MWAKKGPSTNPFRISLIAKDTTKAFCRRCRYFDEYITKRSNPLIVRINTEMIIRRLPYKSFTPTDVQLNWDKLWLVSTSASMLLDLTWNPHSSYNHHTLIFCRNIIRWLSPSLGLQWPLITSTSGKNHSTEYTSLRLSHSQFNSASEGDRLQFLYTCNRHKINRPGEVELSFKLRNFMKHANCLRSIHWLKKI